MLISCEKHADRWESYERMLAGTPFPFVILVGNNSKGHNFVVEPAAVLNGYVLNMDVSDRYEGLFLKVLSGVCFIQKHWPGHAVLKLDDDMMLKNTTRFVELLEKMQETENYTGNTIIHHSFERHISLDWHIGRSYDPSINRTRHRRRCNYQCSYIMGPSYFLSAISVAHVQRYVVESLASDVESQWYEDQAIGEILRFHGILPSANCHLVENGALIKRT
jgi:hypothetical protein